MEKCCVCGVSSSSEIIWNNLPLRMCSMCGLVWRKNIDVELSHYEENDTNLSIESLARRERNVEDRLRLIKKFFTPHYLCDIGAGEGSFLNALRVGNYKNCIGIEPNVKAVTHGVSNGIALYLGDISDAPKFIRDNTIKNVTLFHVIEHLKNPREVVELLFNALPSGGYLVVETPNSDSYSFRKTGYRHPLVYREHLFYFNQKNLRTLLESTGFVTTAMGKRGFDQYHMSISQALFCLGLRKPPFGSSQSHIREQSNMTDSTKKKHEPSFIKDSIRGVLSRLVVLLGRVDYQWIIVKKP